MDKVSFFSWIKTLSRGVINFALVATMPSLFPILIFHIASTFFPMWGRSLVAAFLFCVLLICTWYLMSKHLAAAINEHHRSQMLVWFPLAISIGILLFAAYVFAAMTAVLSHYGVIDILPKVSEKNWSQFRNFYLWYFFDAIPGLAIPKTLNWIIPFHYTDHLSGGLILLFQLLVIAPVIKVFLTWNKVRMKLRTLVNKDHT